MISKLSATTELVVIFTMSTGSSAQDGRAANSFLAGSGEAAYASEWIGETVYASESDAETVGEISDLVVSPEGKIEAVVMEVGGFLGVGEKDVAVGFGDLKFVSRDGGDSYLVLETTRAELDEAPSFQGERTATAQTQPPGQPPAGAPSMGNTATWHAAPAQMSDADCDAAWVSADVDDNGELSDAEKERFLAAARTADHPIATDATLTREVFLENCTAGYFTTVGAPEAGAPLEGANSFTEDQARDRVLAAGYTDVSALSKDANGIWRGTARSSEGETAIAVDFKGNVVPGDR
jgi:hypothetical protein